MGERAERDELGAPEPAPVTGSAVPANPAPGTSTHTSALPRTTSAAAGVGHGLSPVPPPTGTGSSSGETAWRLVPTPHVVRFPATEVGAVSSPQTVTLTNPSAAPVDVHSLVIALLDFAQEPAQQGEFEIVQGQPGRLPPLGAVTVQIVFRPTRVVAHIGAQLRAEGNGAHERLAVTLRGIPVPARADHAAEREFSVAQNTARRLATTGAPNVEHYGDMLAAVLAARELTDQAKPDDATTQAQIAKLLEPVEKRLSQLNDHQGRLAQFGAGNIAGQAALDMSETAVRSWRQRLALGTVVRTEELVTRFRAGAETIRFLTGEHEDAPTLREFDHVSRVVGVGAAVPVLAPPLAALAVEGAGLLAFAPRVAASRVALWALHHPAAALAASEALLGFGLQIGEDGWGNLWEQLQDPQGRWFVIAQVIMDFMHVKSASGQNGSPRGPRSTAIGIEPAPDLEGARQRIARTRSVLQQVHDAAANAEPEPRPTRDPAATVDHGHQAATEPGRDQTQSASAPIASSSASLSSKADASIGPTNGEENILGRSFRSPNASHMPNAVATEALSKQRYDAHTDCSELAHRLRDAAGTGRILRVEPAVRGTLRLLEDGLIEGDMYYHEAYTDGAYVFDVRVSKTPIPKGDWTSVIMKLNPGARIK